MHSGVPHLSQQYPNEIFPLAGRTLMLFTAVLALSGFGAATTQAEAPARPARAADFSAAEPREAFSGGSATAVKPGDAHAFSWPSTSMGFDRRRDFFTGHGLFSRDWGTAAGTGSGLGPLYNATACRRCHFRDGRGRPGPRGEDGGNFMVVRLSIPPRDDAERQRLASGRALIIGEPTYGGQLQERAIAGQRPEGKLVVDYAAAPVTLADGSVVNLRSPRYGIEALAYGPLHAQTQLSPRVAPAMIGLGLLEAIDAEAILARADADDGDGISGRANFVWSDAQHRVMLGRFGWKAGAATIADQVAGALAADLGLSSPLRGDPWGECSVVQSECRAQFALDHGNGLEVASQEFEKIVFYSAQLAVPGRRNVNDANVLRGKALFYASRCNACHTARQVTRTDWHLPALAGQLIWPYTDLLLHDMGQGLADGRSEGAASGSEWRTPPLWGIGLTETVSGHTHFLHDGRARNLLEAILWHDGEARASRDAVRRMDADERQLLLDFLNSL